MKKQVQIQDINKKFIRLDTESQIVFTIAVNEVGEKLEDYHLEIFW